MLHNKKAGRLAGIMIGLSMALSSVAYAEDDPIRISYIDPLSGPFALAGDGGLKSFQFAARKLNEDGGILGRDIEIVPMDSKQSASEAVQLVQRSADEGINFITQGNGSNVAAAIIEATERNNRRNKDNKMLYLNYAAVDPALTNELCSFYHFRFDAASGIKLEALSNYMKDREDISKIFLVNMDYSHGHFISERMAELVDERLPHAEIVGDVLHPVGKVRDFSPYVSRIQQSGADTVVSGNWGIDLALFVRAIDSAGLDVNVYTYYGGAGGVPAGIGPRGEGILHQVTEWHADVNVDEGLKEYEKWFQEFKEQYPEFDWYYHRIYNQMYMLKAAIEEVGNADDIDAIAKALEGMEFESPTGTVTMRAKDHQILQPMYISVMDTNAKYDAENSGVGFRTVANIPVEQATVETSCNMTRP
ncbi:branched-chain amino acid ABC transporter substrate-binding protein [Marinobacter adhaerens]|uniref:Branched-chain amino acid ABC transporter substrate-binding protein n=1 Tax=Marinobacter adhaerens TaxID=1033846 RepID=A0A851HS21_9GAMM|nr:branched-chain amino acid ABC transporter substrate-binding protein [Marinobacter adhaerens]NWN91803.1 branched-chain amino acid ABC transporter substrate-binding protein [Marinobacter adhaerens]